MDSVGHARVFGILEGAGEVITGNISCKGTLHTYFISTDFENVIKNYAPDNLLNDMYQPLLNSSSLVNSNRTYYCGTDSCVVQTARGYTQINAKGITLGNQSGNVAYSG